MRARFIVLGVAVAGGFTLTGNGDGQGPGATPVIQYTFNDGTAGVAVNSGSLGAAGNGAISGAVYSADTPSGGGKSLDFNGTSDHVAVGNVFSYGDAATVECWVKPDDVALQNVIWDDFGNPGVLLTVFNGKLQWNVSTTQTPGVGAGFLKGAVPVGQWVHIAGTYDGAAIRGYVNGVEVGCVATTGTIIENTAPPGIGADNSVTNALNYDGKLDDFRVWVVARSVAELASGQFAGAGRSPDLSGDGVVDGADLGMLLAAWGACANVCCSADLNRDGIVDGADLGILLAAWTI